MTITRTIGTEEAEHIIETLRDVSTPDMQIGGLSVLISLLDPAETDTKQELVTTLVYLQTKMTQQTVFNVAQTVHKLAEVTGVSKDELRIAGELVQQEMEAQYQDSIARSKSQPQSEENSNETKSDVGEQD
jgi:hypothetical protein